MRVSKRIFHLRDPRSHGRAYVVKHLLQRLQRGQKEPLDSVESLAGQTCYVTVDPSSNQRITVEELSDQHANQCKPANGGERQRGDYELYYGRSRLCARRANRLL